MSVPRWRLADVQAALAAFLDASGLIPAQDLRTCPGAPSLLPPVPQLACYALPTASGPVVHVDVIDGDRGRRPLLAATVHDDIVRAAHLAATLTLACDALLRTGEVPPTLAAWYRPRD
jgi:hypothetical protein